MFYRALSAWCNAVIEWGFWNETQQSILFICCHVCHEPSRLKTTRAQSQFPKGDEQNIGMSPSFRVTALCSLHSSSGHFLKDFSEQLIAHRRSRPFRIEDPVVIAKRKPV